MNNASSPEKPGNFAAFMKALWLYLAGILGVVIIFFLLIYLEQGIDVVIQVGERPGPAIWSLVCVLSWIFLVWYSSRLVSYAKQNADDTIPVIYHKHFPRLIAFNCFVAIQAAIFGLHTMESTVQAVDPSAHFYYLHSWGLWLFIICHNALYFLLVNVWEKGKTSSTNIIRASAFILVILYAAWMLYCLIVHWDVRLDYLRHPFWLTWFALVLFVCEILAVYFFINRRKAVDKKVQQNIDANFAPLTTLHKLSLNPKYAGVEDAYFKIFNILSGIAVALFIVVIYSLWLSNRFGPLAVLLLSVGLLIAFFNLITYISIRRRFNINFLFWIWAFIIGLFYDPYKVQTISSLPGTTFAQRPDSKTYFHNWLAQRKNILDADTGKFEVYIVLSNGGASRSGNWVSGILCKLQDSSLKIKPGNSFSQHILCMARASGGTVGNCVFYSLLKAQQEDAGKTELYKHSNNFFAGDFLSYTLCHLTGPDFFRHIIPLDIVKDRAAALEKTLEDGPDDTLMNGLFNRPLSQVFDYSGKLPVLFINSTRVDDGMPGEISSVHLPNQSQRIDILNLLDSNAKQTQNGEIKFATAAILSARFPYVSPAGSILNNYFVDGGYFDNSGGGIVREYMDELKTILNDSVSDPLMKKYYGRLHFTLVHIYNGTLAEDSVKSKKIHPLVNDLFTPLLTLAGIQNSSTKVSDGSLENYFNNFNGDSTTKPLKFNLYEATKSHEEDYPMSWVISAYNLERMKRRCDTVVRRDFVQFKWLLPKK